MKTDPLAFANARWKKSTRSDNNGGACVEVAILPDVVGVRDTKDKGDGPILAFADAGWVAFISGVKRGEFNR
jgi:hypothetical protein